jgi:hypothetical protein
MFISSQDRWLQAQRAGHTARESNEPTTTIPVTSAGVLSLPWPPFPVVRPAECCHCSVIPFIVSTLCQMRAHNDA